MHIRQQELSKITTQRDGFKKLLLFIFCLVIFELTKGISMSKVFGGGGVLSDIAHGAKDVVKDTYNAALDVGGIVMGAYTGYNPRAEYKNQKAQKQALQAQQQAYAKEAAEIDRQRKIQEAQQRRENMQLMNSVSGLTNTSYGGVSSPSIDYDKYGDLG